MFIRIYFALLTLSSALSMAATPTKLDFWAQTHGHPEWFTYEASLAKEEEDGVISPKDQETLHELRKTYESEHVASQFAIYKGIAKILEETTWEEPYVVFNEGISTEPEYESSANKPYLIADAFQYMKTMESPTQLSQKQKNELRLYDALDILKAQYPGKLMIKGTEIHRLVKDKDKENRTFILLFRERSAAQYIDATIKSMELKHCGVVYGAGHRFAPYFDPSEVKVIRKETNKETNGPEAFHREKGVHPNPSDMATAASWFESYHMLSLAAEERAALLPMTLPDLYKKVQFLLHTAMTKQSKLLQSKLNYLRSCLESYQIRNPHEIHAITGVIRQLEEQIHLTLLLENAKTIPEEAFMKLSLEQIHPVTDNGSQWRFTWDAANKKPMVYCTYMPECLQPLHFRHIKN